MKTNATYWPFDSNDETLVIMEESNELVENNSGYPAFNVNDNYELPAEKKTVYVADWQLIEN